MGRHGLGESRVGVWEADIGIKKLMQTIHREDKVYVDNQGLTLSCYIQKAGGMPAQSCAFIPVGRVLSSTGSTK